MYMVYSPHSFLTSLQTSFKSEYRRFFLFFSFFFLFIFFFFFFFFGCCCRKRLDIRARQVTSTLCVIVSLGDCTRLFARAARDHTCATLSVANL